MISFFKATVGRINYRGIRTQVGAGLGTSLPNNILETRIPYDLHFKHTVDFLVDLGGFQKCFPPF